MLIVPPKLLEPMDVGASRLVVLFIDLIQNILYNTLMNYKTLNYYYYTKGNKHGNNTIVPPFGAHAYYDQNGS